MTAPLALSADEARRIALAAQGLGPARDGRPPTWPAMRRMIDRLGLLQIDSVSVLIRAHYLPLFSRLGGYDRALLDAHAYVRRTDALFEYWAHEASLLPALLHPLLRWRMARAERLDGLYGGIADLVRARPEFVAAALAEITARGPLAAADLGARGARSGPWWGWHDGKIALEYLFWAGRVTTAGRRGFARVYDLTERVLAPAILALPTPSEQDARRLLVGRAAYALGVATLGDLRDYFRLGPAAAAAAVAELVESGELLPARVEGWRAAAYLHRDARRPARSAATALLAPFDPLVWRRERAERLFGFVYRIEIYTPAERRVHGYYVLPFLVGGRLAARVDLKADRAGRRLHVIAAFAEPGVRPAPVAAALAVELERLRAWLGLERLTLGERGDLIAELRAIAP